MLQDIFLCARISKGHIPELNGLDLAAENRMLRFPGLRLCIFNFKDTFCRRIALQQARHHKVRLKVEDREPLPQRTGQWFPPDD